MSRIMHARVNKKDSEFAITVKQINNNYLLAVPAGYLRLRFLIMI